MSARFEQLDAFSRLRPKSLVCKRDVDRKTALSWCVIAESLVHCLMSASGCSRNLAIPSYEVGLLVRLAAVLILRRRKTMLPSPNATKPLAKSGSPDSSTTRIRVVWVARSE
jgi:hypothetical protein